MSGDEVLDIPADEIRALAKLAAVTLFGIFAVSSVLVGLAAFYLLPSITPIALTAWQSAGVGVVAGVVLAVGTFLHYSS